jgi:hypothetical protein
MDGCIRKAVEWCEGLPSHDATYVKKMELTETIGVTLKDGVWFHLYLSNNNLDSFLKNIGGYPSRDKVFL